MGVSNGLVRTSKNVKVLVKTTILTRDESLLLRQKPNNFESRHSGSE